MPAALPSPPPDSLHSDAESVTVALKRGARQLGFELVGVVPAVTPTGLSSLFEWIDHGYAGEMQYFTARREAYGTPQSILSGARSIVMLGISYHLPPAAGPALPAAATPPPEPAPIPARVAQYAQGVADYHAVLRDKLLHLAGVLEQKCPGSRARGVVDTAPLLERDFAQRAGLGWFGKNTMLLNRQLGSYFFLAALLVDLELEYDSPQTASYCGTCTRCLEVCPTDAFVAPYRLDARRCISYLTIEQRGPIAFDLREGIGDWLFGCDLCQEVCPWNRKALVTREPAFRQQSAAWQCDPVELLSVSEEEFRTRFRSLPLSRPKRAGLLRNACLVLGNRGDPRAIPALIRALQEESPVVRGAAAWALGKLGGTTAQSALQQRSVVEEDASVLEELDRVLRGDWGRNDREAE